MATRDAVLQRRIMAMERIKAALPNVVFKPTSHLAGIEYQAMSDLETVADALEQRAGDTRKEQPRE